MADDEISAQPHVDAPARASAPLAGVADPAAEPVQPLPLAEVIHPDPTQRQTGKAEPYAYTLRDKTYGEFKVLNSANGWWLDSLKVRDLLQAYKIDCTDEEACAYAGINYGTLRYFKELHPDFLRVKTACKQYPMLLSRKKIVESLAVSLSAATWYAERKRKDEFSRRQEVSGPNGEDILEQRSKLDKLITEIANDEPITKPDTAGAPAAAPSGGTPGTGGAGAGEQPAAAGSSDEGGSGQPTAPSAAAADAGPGPAPAAA